MRWILALVFMMLFAAPLLLARGVDCGSLSSIEVRVTPVLANPVYDFSTGIPEIQAMTDTIVHRVREGWALGFTSYKPVLEMDAPVVVAAAGPGKFCARPRYVNINVGTRDETVFIPREIAGGSCGQHEVITHEQKHLAINHALAEKYAALIGKGSTEYFKTARPVEMSNPVEAAAVQENMLRAVLDDAAVKMITENAALQQDVDSADEYNRLLNVCGGELAALVMQAREDKYLAAN